MKVLQVSTHLNIGGIASYIVSLSSALKYKGIDVVVASSGGNMEEELQRRGLPHRSLPIDTKFEFGPKVFKSALSICSIIKKEGMDIMHAHSRVSQVACLLASRITGVPYVTTCHGFFKTRFRKVFDTWGEMVIAISDAVKSHLTDDLGVAEGRIELVYNGVDTSRFSKSYSRQDLDSIKKSMGLKDAPVVGTIGRLSSVKGQKFLIEAMKEIISKRPDAQALIVGDGDEEIPLKKMTRSLGLENSIYFKPSNYETHKFLSVMDVFVFPSVKEGLGIALLEALASGRACVASDVGGIGNVIDNGSNGILVKVGSASAIADAVLKLINDAGLRAKMGESGRSLVREKFLLDFTIDKIAWLYGRVLNANA